MTEQIDCAVSTAQMLEDLSASFPCLWKRPLSAFGPAWSGKPGIWTGADTTHVMPDGAPIFWTMPFTPRDYDGNCVHPGFVAWLAARGWVWENYDGATFILLPEAAL